MDRQPGAMLSKSCLELTKISYLGETEAGSKAIRDMNQDLKAEIPSLSQPGCCLCRDLGYPDLGYPLRRSGVPGGSVLGVSAGSVPAGGKRSCRGQLGENKSNQALHQLTAKNKESLSQLCAHSSGRSSWRELGACLCHRLEEFPMTERLQARAAKEMSK